MFNIELIVDIGSSYTTIFEKNKGVVLKEPSYILVKKQMRKYKTLAFGKDAVRMAMSSSMPEDALEIYPFASGKVINEEAAKLLIKGFLQTVIAGRLVKPSMDIICTISCGLSNVERNHLEKVFFSIPLVKNVTLIESPIAISTLCENRTNTVVIIGSHLTEIAVVNENGIITGCSIDICGSKMDEAIVKYVADTYRVAIPQERAEDLRKALGSLSDRQQNTQEVAGRNLMDDSKKIIDVTSEDIRIAIVPIFTKLTEVIGHVISLLPSGINVDKENIVLAGGVAGTHGIGEFVNMKTGMPITVLPDANSIVIGASKFFNDKNRMYKMLGLSKN